jgi:MFS family permease
MQSIPFHYGWVILASGALGSFMTTLSRAAIATAYTIGTLAGVLPARFVGRWIDRRGPRVAGVLIGLALAIACVVMASSNSAFSLTIGFAALRGAAIGALSLVSQHVINLWFVTRRGLPRSGARRFRGRKRQDRRDRLAHRRPHLRPLAAWLQDPDRRVQHRAVSRPRES